MSHIGCNSSFWKDTLKMGGIIGNGRGTSVKTQMSGVMPSFGTNKYHAADSLRLNPWQSNPVSMTVAGLTPEMSSLTQATRASHQALGVGKDIFKSSGLWF